MTDNFLVNLKNLSKIYLNIALKHCKKYKAHLKAFLKRKTKRKNIKSLFLSTIKEWKTSSALLFMVIILYYGLGAHISSNINKQLNKNLQPSTANERHATIGLIHSLKSQIDDTPWTPSLPIIFPASILDNLPNFQLGVKDSVKHYIKNMSALYLNQSLKDAGKLLNYSPNIWLFSQDKNDKLLPGSAKQYRKSLGFLSDFSKKQNTQHPLSLDDFIYQINSINKLLETNINKINKHTLENSSNLVDTSADNLFYYTQGLLYTTHYYLSGLGKDYQDLIVETEAYETYTTALMLLKNAINLNPIIVKNAPLESAYSANHLIYLSNYISRTQNKLYEIINHIKKTKDQKL